MDTILYWLARAVIAVLQTLPLRMVARIGRAGGAVAYRLDRRHRRGALDNLRLCFAGGKSPEEIRAIARGKFRRVGEKYCFPGKNAGLSGDKIREILGIAG